MFSSLIWVSHWQDWKLKPTAGRWRDTLRHSQWLGHPQSADAAQTIAVLENDDVDLVVDHYGIDAQWETRVSAHTRAMLVIDDLADRKHVCDYLLDQSHDRSAASLCSPLSVRNATCWLL